MKLWKNDNVNQFVSICVQSCSAIDQIENLEQNPVSDEIMAKWLSLSIFVFYSPISLNDW